MDKLPGSFPFANLRAERLYHFHKLYAEGYATNTRNLEAPWKPVFASILEGVVKKVSDKLGGSIDMAVEQEQPLAPPAYAAAAVDANNTITFSKHKGTVYSFINEAGVHQGGLKSGDSGYTSLVDAFRKAAIQVARQALVAMKRPGETNSDVILVVALDSEMALRTLFLKSFRKSRTSGCRNLRVFVRGQEDVVCTDTVSVSSVQ